MVGYNLTCLGLILVLKAVGDMIWFKINNVVQYIEIIIISNLILIYSYLVNTNVYNNIFKNYFCKRFPSESCTIVDLLTGGRETPVGRTPPPPPPRSVKPPSNLTITTTVTFSMTQLTTQQQVVSLIQIDIRINLTLK